MNDLIIRLTDNSGEYRDESDIYELINDIREIVYRHGFKPRQWGSIESMTISLMKEKEYIEKLIEHVEKPEWPEGPVFEDDGIIG